MPIAAPKIAIVFCVADLRFNGTASLELPLDRAAYSAALNGGVDFGVAQPVTAVTAAPIATLGRDFGQGVGGQIQFPAGKQQVGQSCACEWSSLPSPAMKDFLTLLAYLLTTVAKLLRPGGARAVVADNPLRKQQLLVINRSRRRAPNLSALDRILLGFWSLFLSPHRIQRAAVIFRPSTLLRFHEALKKRKYRLLFSSRPKGKPGPKGPSSN